MAPRIQIQCVQVLAIIHDGMDTNKTTKRDLQVTTKAIASLFQLHVSLSGTLTHGYNDGAYAHYTIDLWPKDLNFTISSLVRCLRPMENPLRWFTGKNRRTTCDKK